MGATVRARRVARRGNRQPDDELAALTGPGAKRCHFSAVQLHQSTHHRESNTQPGFITRIRAVSLREKIEYPIEHRFRYSNAVVAHADHYPIVLYLGRQVDAPPCIGVLRRVVE